MTTKHEKRPAPVVGEHVESEFSDADIADISQEDLRQRSEALDDAQEAWENFAYLSTRKIPCRECGGRGTTAAGSFGDIECPLCHGKRVVEEPGQAPIEMPPFAQLREAITAYGSALADRHLPEGHKGKRYLALPAATTVPTVDAIGELLKQGVTRVKQITAAPVDQKQIDAPAKRSEDQQGEFSDDDLDQAEASDE